MIWTAFIFLAGLLLVIYFSEKLVEGTVGTAYVLGISAFLISVIFIGFDPENLALGAVASYEQSTGIALGTIFGAAMVAMALAFGITALIAPMKFEKAPVEVVMIPVLSVMFIATLSFDGLLSRLDGFLLLAGFVTAIFYLIKLTGKGLNITPGGEVAEVLEEEKDLTTWKAIGLLIFSLAAIIIGSEMIVRSSKTIIAELGFSETVFGMTILALLVSIEELARELPAALKGRPDISYGNVAGSVLAFFLFNAGIIALIRPIPVSGSVLSFHLPIAAITVFFISFCMLRKQISRWAGLILVILYAVFFGGSFFI